MRKYLLTAVAAGAVIAATGSYADEAAAQKWIDEEFQPSALTKDEQLAEMQWFINAAEPYKGMEINVLSEGIPRRVPRKLQSRSAASPHQHDRSWIFCW